MANTPRSGAKSAAGALGGEPAGQLAGSNPWKHAAAQAPWTDVGDAQSWTASIPMGTALEPDSEQPPLSSRFHPRDASMERQAFLSDARRRVMEKASADIREAAPLTVAALAPHLDAVKAAPEVQRAKAISLMIPMEEPGPVRARQGDGCCLRAVGPPVWHHDVEVTFAEAATVARDVD